MNTICLSENANNILKERLRIKKYELIEVKKTDAVYESISAHCDIYLCKIYNELVVAPVQAPLIRDELLRCGISYYQGVDRVGYRYPANIRYNAAQVGRHLIHDTSHTDPAILNIARELGMKLIHVKQGYSKCNLVVVDDNSVITSDLGLAAAMEKNGIDILLISPGHVDLPGLPYGFLGGASGKVDYEIIFNGNLSAHPDFEEIEKFIRQRDLRVTWFEEYPLEDIGSIIQL
ncbi:MAG TPA: hypothetical protein VN381_15975 [Anaerovoracaceae bacterium]|nr:hypothetical protein [Anaerovoracaceae bacterium]